MSAPLSNRLAAETSPYLRQHAANPVAWQPWDAAALAAARDRDKPILLSIGYSACHWCHVMAHESFEDASVAAVMNELFINIKVDREERPDLDQIYQTAHQMLTQRSGGWPLTLFLTPDGTPFFGGTYFPKAPRYGLPGFADLCQRVAAAYATRRADIETQNRDLRAALAATTPRATGGGSFDAAPLELALHYLERAFDAADGGFGRAPKFPHPTDLAFLLRRPEAEARRMALFSLTRMASGGLYDQIGGGFCRYSVDGQWEIPHFEKMLYDNGPLLGLYADAWAQTGEPLYRRVVEETVEWVQREMQASPNAAGTGGGFYAAIDADSEGEEGKFYVWSREEVQALLDADSWRVLAPHWGLDRPPNFEGHWHLKLAAPLAATELARRDAARATLFAARARRVRPGLDDKILTSWNALMIDGLAHAARICQRPDWLAAADQALDYLRRHHWREGRLLACTKAGVGHLPGYLDDHAFLLAALLEMLQARYRQEDMDLAVALAEALLTHFADADAGGFFFTADDHEALIHRPKPGHDNATPSGNGAAAFALQRLGHLLGEPRYLRAAEATLRLFWPELAANPGASGSLLRSLEEALTPPDIIILRGPAEQVADWQQRLGAAPQRLVLALPNEIDAAQLSPVLQKPVSRHVNAWLCRGVTCLAPLADFAELESVLSPV